MKTLRNKMAELELQLTKKASEAVKGTKAEAYVDSAIKILIAVVVGGLLLAGVYALFTKVIFPRTASTTSDMFEGESIQNDDIDKIMSSVAAEG